MSLLRRLWRTPKRLRCPGPGPSQDSRDVAGSLWLVPRDSKPWPCPRVRVTHRRASLRRLQNLDQGSMPGGLGPLHRARRDPVVVPPGAVLGVLGLAPAGTTGVLPAVCRWSGRRRAPGQWVRDRPRCLSCDGGSTLTREFARGARDVIVRSLRELRLQALAMTSPAWSLRVADRASSCQGCLREGLDLLRNWSP